MKATEFRDLAIAACRRQMAAGSSLIAEEWGGGGDDVDGPVECGCALTLTIQDRCGPRIARDFLGKAQMDETLAGKSARKHLGITPAQAMAFLYGFDDHAPPEMDVPMPWWRAGNAVRMALIQKLPTLDDDEPDPSGGGLADLIADPTPTTANGGDS